MKIVQFQVSGFKFQVETSINPARASARVFFGDPGSRFYDQFVLFVRRVAQSESRVLFALSSTEALREGGWLLYPTQNTEEV